MSHRTSRIFILYPRGVRTGGPEALHQLARQLLNLGLDARLVPTPRSMSNERDPSYDHYDVPETIEVIDDPTSLVIASETDLDLVGEYQHASVACWWLSIDNSARFSASIAAASIPAHGLRNRLRSVKWAALETWERVQFMSLRMRAVEHYAQSEYAWSALRSRGISASLLSDYTVGALVPPDLDSGRLPLVAFNGRKGGDMSHAVAEAYGPGAEFRAIEDMTAAEVRETLVRSSVYLDLGWHPGKDRMPREAAMAGCVVMVARRGSGTFSLDVPIPEHHKVDVQPFDHADAARQVAQVINDLPHQYSSQALYRRIIEHERERFAAEVERIFIDGTKGCATSLPDLIR